MLNNKYLFYQSGGKYYAMNGGNIWEKSKVMVKDEAKEFGKKVVLNGVTMMFNEAGIDPKELSNNPEVKEELMGASKEVLALGQELAEELKQPLKEFTEQVMDTTEDVGGQVANSLSQTGVNIAVDAITPIPVVGPLAALANTINQTTSDVVNTYGKSMESYKELSESVQKLMDVSSGVVDKHSENIKSSVLNIKNKLEKQELEKQNIKNQEMRNENMVQAGGTRKRKKNKLNRRKTRKNIIMNL